MPRCETSNVIFDSPALAALLALAQAQDRDDAEVQAARLRALLGVAGPRLEPHIAALIARAEELQRTQRLALTDALTGVANRRALHDALRRELARARRARRPLAILLIDIDDFKAINDRFGHARGDEALKILARCMRRATRAGDLVARIGGDEFALLLPETAVREARAIGERIRAELARSGKTGLNIGVSLGLAFAYASPMSATELLTSADRGLYRDKNARRTARVACAVSGR